MHLLIHHELVIPKDHALQRLDQSVAVLLPQYSRGRLQQWIKQGDLTVNGKAAKPKDKVLGGEMVTVSLEEVSEDSAAEDIPIDVVFEDSDILVINKPPGLVVHPGAGNATGTLLNALLNHDEAFGYLPRAGIVHRLDKDTSGLMVVARTLESQNYLVNAIQEREVTRIYEALVYGVMPVEGVVEKPIGRHPVQRKKMAVRSDGKFARTFYRVLKQFDEHAQVECRLDSGRTHQIRVHMQHLGHPILGDTTYGGGFRRPKSGDQRLVDSLTNFGRQALHAKMLVLHHPTSGKQMKFRADVPDDYAELFESLHA